MIARLHRPRCRHLDRRTFPPRPTPRRFCQSNRPQPMSPPGRSPVQEGLIDRRRSNNTDSIRNDANSLSRHHHSSQCTPLSSARRRRRRLRFMVTHRCIGSRAGRSRRLLWMGVPFRRERRSVGKWGSLGGVLVSSQHIQWFRVAWSTSRRRRRRGWRWGTMGLSVVQVGSMGLHIRLCRATTPLYPRRHHPFTFRLGSLIAQGLVGVGVPHPHPYP